MIMEHVVNSQSHMGCHRNCLVFATHRLDEEILRYLSYLKREVEGVMDLLVLYDQSARPVKEDAYPEYQFCFFDSAQLKGFFHQNDRLLPNPFVALAECAKQYRYDHYLLMENDIVLHGAFNMFVRKVDMESTADYIHIAADVEGGPLHHWPVRYIRDNPFANLYFSWCHILYVSRGFLTDVAGFMRKNDSFYYEFLLPTMAYNGSYVVRQFENLGYSFQVSWGPAGLYEAKYLNERVPDAFYHPIKNLGIADFW